MRSKRVMPTTPIGLPPYFPRSRYVTTGEDLVIDHQNKRIVSLPTVTDQAILLENPIKHVAIRSVKDQLLNKAENAILGVQSQASNDSGVHPGILYGGPAGGILAPIGVYFYRIFKKKWRRKKKKKKKTEDSDDESEEENEEETVRSTITTAITSRISNASTSVVNHIKGKFAATGATLVDDLKAQAIAQEEEMLENMKTTMLEQEEELMTDIKEKFAKTQKSLMQDIKSRFSIFEKSLTTETSTFDEKRKEEETLIRLSDSEEELMNTVKRRISNAQDALIPEIERSIETTNEKIIKNVENNLPEMKGHTWNTFKARMKDRSGCLFNEIKSILTCTENKIIDDVKSHIEEVKTDELVKRNSTATDEISVEIVQPSVKHIETRVQIENTEENSISLQPNEVNESQEVNEISQNPWNQYEKENITMNEIKKEELTDEIIGDTYNTGEHVIIVSESEFQPKKLGCPIISTTSAKQNAEAEDSPENTSRLNKIKHKIAEIPGHFLKPNPKMTLDKTQAEKKKEEIHLNIEKDTNISEEAIHRTSPIPIPCIHGSRSYHHPITKDTVSDQNLLDSNSDKSSSEEKQDEEENSSFFDRMKNSVSHLPFNFNFSGIPEKVKSFIEPTKRDVIIETKLTEIKVVGEHENSCDVPPSLMSDEESQTSLEKKDNESRENLSRLIDNTEHPPSRRWIVLEYDNEDWPEHLPRKTDPKEEKVSDEEIKPSKVRWLEFVEEDVNSSWPNHLPKNLHVQKDTMKGENSRTHMKKKRRKLKNEDSDSEEEDNEYLSKETHLLKPIKTEDDRKESTVSSASEFSTTSSVDFTSSGTLESSTSSKLPNFERKSKKKDRNARLKSLDSGIHHYYGEYIAIEFPISDADKNNVACSNSTEKNCIRDISNASEEGSSGGSSENSQEDVKSVISSTEANKEEEVRNDDAAQSSNEVSEDLGGCYEGVVVSLQNSKRSS